MVRRSLERPAARKCLSVPGPPLLLSLNEDPILSRAACRKRHRQCRGFHRRIFRRKLVHLRRRTEEEPLLPFVWILHASSPRTSTRLGYANGTNLCRSCFEPRSTRPLERSPDSIGCVSPRAAPYPQLPAHRGSTSRGVRWIRHARGGRRSPFSLHPPLARATGLGLQSLKLYNRKQPPNL